MEVSPSENNSHEEISASNKDDQLKLDQCIKEIIEKEGFIRYKVNKQRILTKGSNYCGFLYEIGVNGESKDGDKELNIFVKLMNEKNYTVTSISDFYKKELFAYQDLLKIFAVFQEKANIPEEERYKAVKFYEESYSEAILLENMTKKGFETSSRYDATSLILAEASIKQLAKFHALSFVLKEKNPKYFNEKIKPLKYCAEFNETWPPLIEALRDSVVKHVDETYKEKVIKEYNDIIFKYVDYHNDETIKVCLCHGDFKSNNILTKIKHGEIQEMIPIDYQLLFYGSPIFDFFYFLYCCTDKKFRQDHTSYLKDLYYETLRKFLGYFELDADVIYSRDEFEKVYKEKLDLGLMLALLILPFYLSTEEEHADDSGLSYKIDRRFKERIQGVLDDYIEWGYL